MSCVHTHAHMCLEQGGLEAWDGDVTVWTAGGGGGVVGASCSQLSGSLQGTLAASLSSWLGTWEHALLNLCPKSPAPTLRPHPQYLHSHLASRRQQAQEGQHRAEA